MNLGGYKYYLHYEGNNGLTNWRCYIKSCKGRVSSFGGEYRLIQEHTCKHSHDVGGEGIKKIIINNT